MIYFIEAEGVGHIKIGFTDGVDANARLANLQTGSPVPLRVLHTMPGTLDDEKNLHRRFAAVGVGGEWFKPVPELLELIPVTKLKRCGDTVVSERSISIRTMTVGRKQFTKNLLWQLPTAICLDWKPLIDRAISDACLVGVTSCFTPNDFEKVCDPLAGRWGWVKSEGCDGCLIFDKGCQLYRQMMSFADIESLAGLQPGDVANAKFYSDSHYWKRVSKISKPLEDLFATRKTVVGLRDQDQLFIAV